LPAARFSSTFDIGTTCEDLDNLLPNVDTIAGDDGAINDISAYSHSSRTSSNTPVGGRGAGGLDVVAVSVVATHPYSLDGVKLASE
jgi:hypothetical protein